MVADVIYGMKVKAEQWFGRKQRPGRRGSREDRPGRVRAIVTDLVGRPTELVDETGHIAWHTRATLWGTTTWNKDATAYTPLRFPGQYADLETGLHHNYFRHYDPELGRFAFPDPLGLAPADNPVAYVASPLVWSDPLGITPCKETFYRVMSKKEFDRLGPNGEINVRVRTSRINTPTLSSMRWNQAPEML
ncbi:hypothetical protein GCM10012287_18570 [Streptomyces daqingensis]|uniref:Teneurin-like YD-shell domain-containing protein n=1 Tax=Streptomyces daqingensis TaxID=1472640 RepID=A0ABQ2M554_9ACTN|nr:hypothetical protein GCM10012287_18570 [Streptomyces daqingensis]